MDELPPESTADDFMSRTVVEVKNVKWVNEEQTIIVAEVLFGELNSLGFIPFSTMDGADTDHGQEVWDNALAGHYGPIAAFVPPTPEEIRANMPDLERWRVNTIIDLEPGLRDKINTAIEAMPDPQRTISRNKLSDVQMFSRTDPLFELIGSDPSIGKTPEDIDAMWQAAADLG